MKGHSIFGVLVAAGSVLAQNKSSSIGVCTAGFYAGTDTIIYTVPYTYPQVLSVIGDFRNITWNNIPDDAVSLNGIDNTIGTARSFKAAGVTATETLVVFAKPAAGPFVEVNAVSPFNLGNTTIYSNLNSIVATPVCGGAACTLNITVDFCTTDTAQAADFFHMVHLTDVLNVGLFLGGRNFTSCAALGTNSSTTAAASPNASGVPFTGGASRSGGPSTVLAAAVAIAAVLFDDTAADAVC